MNRAAKVATGVVVVVVAGLVTLAAPAVAGVYGVMSSWELSQPTEELVVEADPGSDEDNGLAEQMLDELGDGYVYVGNGTTIPKGSPAGCEKPAWLHIGGMKASLSGDLVDRGVRDLAAGTTGLNDAGAIVTYTVAPGDAPHAIGDRFCIANPLMITMLNHTRTIQPGEVLLLRPDSSIPWIPYFNPDDAPAGYQQIPYQLAVEAMSAAAHAGDLDAMRAIFANDLAHLFPDPTDAELIAQALDAGDLDVLRHMFA